jgi:Fe(3+) dicitrate transport protein
MNLLFCSLKNVKSLFSLIISYFFCFFSLNLYAQTAQLQGTIRANGQPVAEAYIATKDGKVFTQTNEEGKYLLTNIALGTQTFFVFREGFAKFSQTLTLQAPQLTYNLDVSLLPITQDLEAVTVEEEIKKLVGVSRLKAVDGFGIYEGKKTEVIVMKDLTANLATNNARQVYAKIAGLNVWESDGAGLQLGIGGRGLSPNRTANFNTRQNGYDIAADALGYPESYYTPPAEAIEKIEIVRGAASLQYGTQFGGMLNFKLKKGNPNEKIAYTGRQSAGSWGFLNSFNSIGGQVGKVNYYAFYQRKQGDGWRPNSAFHYNMAYAALTYEATEKLSFTADYTYMNYLAKQAGGLSDALFEQNPQQSVRSRNWFAVDWNLASFSINYKFSSRTKLNIRNFGVLARRQALGNLERINVADFGQNRDLIDGVFRNIGNETRLLHHYTIGKQNMVFLAGFRLYKGFATNKQGQADKTSEPNFSFLNPNDVENSDYNFPSYNASLFVEHIFNVSSKISITPGLRFENIQTFSEGYYKQRVFDGAGNLIVDKKINDNQERIRSFLIAGLGISYKPKAGTEIYANISQNYRAINFTDIRINNPNIIIDPNIQDEKGYSTDLGIRGNWKDYVNYDFSLFAIQYNNRIGLLLKADQPPLYLDYRYRTNIADALNIGIESYVEVDMLKILTKGKSKAGLAIFANLALIDANYINTEDPTIKDKKVELVPPLNFRSGVSLSLPKFRASCQYSYTAEHFTDASNARRSSTAVNGIIPAYAVMDFSASYNFCKQFTVEASCNNVLNSYYFSRRADAYPGPGIIPADARAFYLTLQVWVGSKKK